MPTAQNKSRKPERDQKSKELTVTLLTALFAALPPLILAIAELLKAGHVLGWW